MATPANTMNIHGFEVLLEKESQPFRATMAWGAWDEHRMGVAWVAKCDGVIIAGERSVNQDSINYKTRKELREDLSSWDESDMMRMMRYVARVNNKEGE